MKRRPTRAVVVSGLILLTNAACSSPTSLDGEVAPANLVVRGARLVAPDTTGDRFLMMTLESGTDDRLTAVTFDTPKNPPKFALYQPTTVMTATTAPVPTENRNPKPTDKVAAVTLEADKAVAFGWDGYAAIVTADALVDRKAKSVNLILEFEHHTPIRLAVPVVTP